MKLQYKLGILTVAAVALASCSMHDPFEEIMEVGQPLPVVAWELGSTVATAGDSVSFKGKYYTDSEHTPDHAEVWGTIAEAESQSATLHLTPTYAYTKTVTKNDTVRASLIASYPHSMATWNGHEYELNVKFPTSSTLKSVKWTNISEWDQKTFDSYYPSTFQKEFVDEVVNTLTKDSTYYADLRYVYVNYDFTAEQIQGVIAKYPTLNTDGKLDALVNVNTDEKSNIWYSKIYKTDDKGNTTTEKNVVGKYYIEIVNGVQVYREVPLDYVNPNVTLYDVYESSPWLFCRYDDNVGADITTVRPAYMPMFKQLISLVPFTDWIYDSSNKVYSVTFSRQYSMGVTFKVVDTNGNTGYTTDALSVTLN